MLPTNPWDAFSDQLEKLDQERRKSQPVREWIQEECPAFLWYSLGVIVLAIFYGIPWVLGMIECVKWIFKG